MLGIIVVIYKSHEQTLAYVSRQLPKIALEHRTVVVDLASDVAVSKELAEKIGAVWLENGEDDIPAAPLYVLHTPENLGYARGNNLGVKFLLGIDGTMDKMLFSNDDIEFLSDNVVDVLAERLDTMPDVGCIGPMVVDLKGKLQGPGYRRPEIGYTVRRNFGEPLLGAARYSLVDGRERVSEKVYMVEGCFHLVRTENFLAAGMFDERTFLYWEERILSERLAKIGKSVYYEASVKILHYIGNTIKKQAPNLLLVKCELAGQRIYYCNYRNISLFAKGLLGVSAMFRLSIVKLCVLKRKLLGI